MAIYIVLPQLSVYGALDTCTDSSWGGGGIKIKFINKMYVQHVSDYTNNETVHIFFYIGDFSLS